MSLSTFLTLLSVGIFSTFVIYGGLIGWSTVAWKDETAAFRIQLTNVNETLTNKYLEGDILFELDVTTLNTTLLTSASDLNTSLCTKIMQGDAILQDEIDNIELSNFDPMIGPMLMAMNDSYNAQFESLETQLTGAAGGDLTGNYPNPTLVTTTVTPGSFGTATETSTFTVDSKGRLTSAGTTTLSLDAPPSGAAGGGELTGTYPNPTLTSTTVTPGSYGSMTEIATFTVDSKGRITSASNVMINSGMPAGSAGGDLTGTYPNPALATTAVTPGSYGSMTQIATFTVDSKGRVTTAASVSFGTLSPNGAAGGDLMGTYPNPTLIATTVVAGTYGNASQMPTYTVNNKGRLLLAGTITIDGGAPSGAAGGDFTGTFPNPILTDYYWSFSSPWVRPVIQVGSSGRLIYTYDRRTGYTWNSAQWGGIGLGTQAPYVVAPANGNEFIVVRTLVMVMVYANVLTSPGGTMEYFLQYEPLGNFVAMYVSGSFVGYTQDMVLISSANRNANPFIANKWTDVLGKPIVLQGSTYHSGGVNNQYRIYCSYDVYTVV